MKKPTIRAKNSLDDYPRNAMKTTLFTITIFAISLFVITVLPLQSAVAQIRFNDVTSEALGVYRSETWGISVGDYNGDFWPDVFVGNHRDRPAFYKNNGDGSFSNVILQVDRDRMWLANRYHDHHGAAFADVDGDGDDDLHVSTNAASIANFAESDGNFVRSRAVARNVANDSSGWSVAFLDHNKDGRIDMSRLSFDNSDLRTQNSAGQFNTGPRINCTNNNYAQLADLTGDGFLDFICASEGNFPQRVYDFSNGFPRQVSAGGGLLIGNTLDTLIADLDGDLSNEILAVRGAIFPNQAKVVAPGRAEAFLDSASGQGNARYTFNATGPVTFTLHGRGIFPSPISVGPGSSRTFNAGGIGNDARFLVTSSGSGSWSARLSSGQWASLYIEMTASNISNVAVDRSSLRSVDFPILPRLLNKQGGNWVNRTTDFGFRYAESCAGVVAADFDNDMDLDVYMSCRGGVENLANRLYKNNGNGVFGRISNFGGEGVVGAGLRSGAGTSENVVTLDFDNDGFMDVFVANGLNDMPLREGGPHQLLRNSGNGNNWIQLKLVGNSSSAPAIGARVLATAAGKTQVREQNGGFHRWSQNDQRIHFGLAGNARVDLLVEWPNGRSQSFSNVQANRHYRITENQGIAAVSPGAVKSLPAARPGDECGSPTYIPAYDLGLFLYKTSCGSNRWTARLIGGQEGAALKGRITELNGGSLSNASGNNLENDDVLRLGANQLDFTLGVRAGAIDGFDISLSGQACLIIDTPAKLRTMVGSRHVDVPSRGFNLGTFQRCSFDNDNDGIPDNLDPDDDNDGTNDVDDALPFDPTETVDSDRDGVGNNADSDDDNDGVADSNDLFPLDPRESADSDRDGTGDNADTDDDNDGIVDGSDSAIRAVNLVDNFESNTGWTINPDGNDTATTGRWQVADPQQTSSGVVLQRGDTPSGTNGLITQAAAGSDAGTFDIDNGKTSALSRAITVPSTNARIRFSYYLAHLTNATSADYLRVFVRATGRSKNLLNVPGSSRNRAGNWGTYSGDISEFAGQTIRIFVEAADAGSASLVEAALDDLIVTGQDGRDVDGDGIQGPRDLDSDNDGLWDSTESGGIDANRDGFVDRPADRGSISSPRDSDNDGIADHLDLESNNPANDGTRFDIANSGAARFDSNGDGRINRADANGGVDRDADGIDDLIDGNPNQPGSGGGGGGGGGTATLSVSDIAVNESGGSVSVKIRLSAPAAAPVSVTAFTRDRPNSARAGQDYYGKSSIVSIPAGQTVANFNVTLLNDSTSEGDERFEVRLVNASGAAISDGVAIVTVSDDDGSGGAITLSIDNMNINESAGVVRIPVKLSRAATTAVRVTAFTRDNGNAEQGSGNDFFGATNVLVFSPGETQKVFIVTIIDDNAREGPEAFSALLTSSSGASIADPAAVVTILDND